MINENESYYKQCLYNKFIKDNDNNIGLMEVPISNSRADFIVLGNIAMVFEIKTDIDNLNRLSSQIQNYYKAFTYVSIVVGDKYIEYVMHKFYDTTLGIYKMNHDGNILCLKKPDYNDIYLSYDVIFQMLRKYEFEEIIKKEFGCLPKVNDFMYYRTCLELIKKINILKIQHYMIIFLKKRNIK